MENNQPTPTPDGNTPTQTTQPPAQGSQGGTQPTGDNPAKTDAPAKPGADNPGGDSPTTTQGGTQPPDGGDKPFLGGKKEEPKNPDGSQPPKDGNQPTAPDEKAYLDAIVKDEKIFGKDDNLTFDQNLLKAVIPACQKYGVSTEAANAIANAFAKAQLDGARAAYKERCDYFAKANAEARAKYSDGDFEQINRGIDKYFKPGGAMNFTIRNSELGADPEFLALMHELGAAVKEDTGKGAAAGNGSDAGDPNGINGLSKIW